MKNKIHNTDCLKYIKSLPNDSIDTIITDPPYGLLDGHKIEDGFDSENLPLFFSECYRILKPDSFLVFFGMQPSFTKWIRSATDQGFKWGEEIIWYKKQAGCFMLPIRRVHENIAIMKKGNAKFSKEGFSISEVTEGLGEFLNAKTVDSELARVKQILKDKKSYEEALDTFHNGSKYDRKDSSRNDPHLNSVKLKDSSKDNFIIRIKNGRKPCSVVGFTPHNRIRFGENADEYNIKHPTVKPIKLLEYLIRITTQPGQLIFDPFAGSGTTLIASKRLGRDYLGCEIVKEYFDIAIGRLNSPELVEQHFDFAVNL